jgi:nitrogen regulatory protein P-II 1
VRKEGKLVKEIKAIVQSSALYPVLMAVRSIPDMPALLMSEVRVFPKGHPSPLSPSHGMDGLDSVQMLKLECIVPDEMCDAAVEAIRRAAHTGRPADGSIFIYDVEDAVKIRTGQRGGEAV